MGNTWYWSERLMRSRNHAAAEWPRDNNSWRYVGVTHEAYIHPVRTLSHDLFISYVGDTDTSSLPQMPDVIAGSFYIAHDAEKTPEKTRQRLMQDVHLLEQYLDKPDAHLDEEWQYTRGIFYLAQSHRSLGHLEVAEGLWQRRYLAAPLSQQRQFSYLRYGAHLGLAQICAVAGGWSCQEHFEAAHRLCPRAEPLVYLALHLPAGSRRLDALQRAQKVKHLQASLEMMEALARPGRSQRAIRHEEQGSNLYVKLPKEEAEFAWEFIPHTNIYSPQGIKLEDEDDSNSFRSCQRRCSLSRYCQCFVYENATHTCERFVDCAVADFIVDRMYDVYMKERQVNMQAPQDIAWWVVWVMIGALAGGLGKGSAGFATYERASE
ncbi:unnamed protein product [Effrenium voratum]|nr:unnamed protein product [Effrenium voratum]